MLRQLFGNSTLKYCRRLSNLIMAQRYDFACKNADRDLQEFYPRLHRYLELQIAEKGANHIYSCYKLWELAGILKQHKPKLIVEFGSGSTTAAFAEYAELDSECTVISVDEYEPYHQQVFDRLQLSGIKPNARVHQCFCPKLIETKNGQDVTRYEPRYIDLLAGRIPDLIYVDGPTTNHPDKPGMSLPCMDAVYLCEQGIRPRMIAYDYRIASVRAFIASRYSHLYDASLHHLVSLPEDEPWVVQTVRHHTQLYYNSCRELEILGNKSG